MKLRTRIARGLALPILLGVVAGELAPTLARGVDTAAALQRPPRDDPRAPLADTASVGGRVTISGVTPPVPVRRARVTVESDALAEPRVAETDADGRYRVDRLPPGRYRVTAEKPGFVRLASGARHPSPSRRPST